MSQVNIQRSSELRLNRGTLHKLRGQKEGLEQAITDAEKERDLWSKKVPGASGKRNHPWDALHLQSDSLDNQGLEATGINNATMQNAADISYRTAPKGTMSDILGKL